MRHAGELFQRLLESRTRLRAGNPLRGAHQRVRRRVECVERLLGERGGAGGIGIALLELLARQFHLILRVAEGGLELWRDERVTTGCRADLLFDRVCAFLDGGLPGARRGTRFAVTQRSGDFLLTTREGRRFGQRAIQRVERLLSPGGGQGVASLPELVRQLRQ